MTPEQLAALVAERDALKAEVARLSTPPNDAEVHWSITSGLEAYPHYPEAVQRKLSVNVNMWGLRQMVVNLTRLSHALAAEKAKREAMEDALTQCVEAYDRSNPMRMADMHRDICDCPRCANDTARATLAKHGSKT